MRLWKGIRGGCLVFCAVVFGRYDHSGWDGEVEYHIYWWRGQRVKCPR